MRIYKQPSPLDKLSQRESVIATIELVSVSIVLGLLALFNAGGF